MNAATATPAGAHNDMGLRIAALVNKVEAARRAEFEPCGLAALALLAFTDAVELAAKEGRGISAEGTQGLEQLRQAYDRAREPMLLAFSDTARATAVLLHALEALYAGWANG